MSNEHVWPQWLKEVMPDVAAQTQNWHEGSLTDPTTGKSDTTSRAIPNTILESKVRRPCKRCNESWMNDIESAARPVLTSLILGQERSLSSDDLTALAVWTAKTVVVYEFVYPRTAAIPEEHHRFLFEAKMPLPNMNIWIARLEADDGTWKNRTRHITIGLYGAEEHPDPPEMNTYATTIGLGNLIIQAVGTTRPDLAGTDGLTSQEFIDTVALDGILRVWPDPKPLEWPPTSGKPATEESAWELSSAYIETLAAHSSH
jgi:hypothetical protein